MQIEQTSLPGVVILTPARFGDARGFFSETWSRRRLAEAGIDIDFVQDNHSVSAKAGTLRGLHFQSPPHAQTKLVRCGRGALFDVAVDIRQGSLTFGQWFGLELSAENKKQVWIPAGLAHGFLVTSESAEFLYKTTDYYHPEFERSLLWSDSAIGIDWPLHLLAASPLLAAKDAQAPTLQESLLGAG